jgi:hypothetical protein
LALARTPDCGRVILLVGEYGTAMNIVAQFVEQHPYLVSAVATWLVNNVITALISSLPSPTATSTVKYQYWFKVLNTISGNVQRARSTAIEQSPNWQDAVDRHLAGLGIPPQTPRQ